MKTKPNQIQFGSISPSFATAGTPLFDPVARIEHLDVAKKKRKTKRGK
jgi:hypothetical protein